MRQPEPNNTEDNKDLERAFNLAALIVENLKEISGTNKIDVIDLYIGTKVTWNIESEDNILTLVFRGEILGLRARNNTLMRLSPENLKREERKVIRENIILAEYKFLYRDHIGFLIREIPYSPSGSIEGLVFSGPFLGTFSVDKMLMISPWKEELRADITLGLYKVDMESYLRVLLGILEVTSWQGLKITSH